MKTPVPSQRARDESHLLPVLTLVIWASFVAVGVAGFLLRYHRPTPLAKAPPPVLAQTLHVELTSDPLPRVAPVPRSIPSQPPRLAEPLATLPTPPMLAVAAPSPAIVFAVPIQAAQVVEPARASFRTPVVTPEAQAAPVAVPQPLTYGVGEGKQPAPEYPRLAMRLGQEGSVVVRFTVAQDGRVTSAEAASPSPWPMLNEAALRVVRQRWRFGAGTARTYEVAIRFQLNKTSS